MKTIKVSELKEVSKILNSTDNANLYLGIGATTTNSTGSSLTIEDFDKALEYWKSEEYKNKVYEQEKTKAMGEIILSRALSQKLITIQEYTVGMASLGLNGILLVSPDLSKKLCRVKFPRRMDS